MLQSKVNIHLGKNPYGQAQICPVYQNALCFQQCIFNGLSLINCSYNFHKYNVLHNPVYMSLLLINNPIQKRRAIIISMSQCSLWDIGNGTECHTGSKPPLITLELVTNILNLSCKFLDLAMTFLHFLFEYVGCSHARRNCRNAAVFIFQWLPLRLSKRE